jgi:hypothetical protein
MRSVRHRAAAVTLRSGTTVELFVVKSVLTVIDPLR